MLGYLYKDFATNKKTIRTLLLVLVLFNAMVFMLFVGDDVDAAITDLGVLFQILMFSFSACSFFISGAMASNYFKTDERKKWGYYVVSTPRGISKQMVSKYIMVLIMSLITFTVSVSANILARNLFSKYDIPNVTGVVLIFLFIQIMIRAIETPFIVGIGQKAGEMVKGMLMLGLILFTVIYLMFADISWIGSSDHVIEKIFDLITKIRFTDFIKTWGGRLVMMSVPLYILSCFISIKLFTYGIERIEK
ncbi:MAG: ABC-2 transporter permease [Ruminococcus sp.]|nr:ABC-2 transporter permease [Ruminococcus sp.]